MGEINGGTASSFEASNTCKHSSQTSKNLLNLQDILLASKTVNLL